MSSPRPPNNGNIYPNLPAQGTSAGTPNHDSGTNNNAQSDASNNAAGGSSGNTANQASNQTSGTTRQTRSSGRGAKIAFESLGPINDLSQSQLREQQQYEIDRIISGSPDEALGQFHHADKAAMTQIYKQLSTLIHPDKQPEEWKGKANDAQQS